MKFPHIETEILKKTGLAYEAVRRARKGLEEGKDWAIRERFVVYSDRGKQKLLKALGLESDEKKSDAVAERTLDAMIADGKECQMVVTRVLFGTAFIQAVVEGDGEKLPHLVKVAPRATPEMFKPGMKIKALRVMNIFLCRTWPRFKGKI